jgi:hypothetical protein
MTTTISQTRRLAPPPPLVCERRPRTPSAPRATTTRIPNTHQGAMRAISRPISRVIQNESACRGTCVIASYIAAVGSALMAVVAFGVAWVAYGTWKSGRDALRAGRYIDTYLRTQGDSETRVRGHYRVVRKADPSWSQLFRRTLSLWAERHLGRWGFGCRVPGRPARPACRLTDAASFFLPAADRARYAAEYRSELWDLARAGAGCLRQLLYALRQFRAAVPMAFALRSPRRKGAAS